jgi:hypothetical protein
MGALEQRNERAHCGIVAGQQIGDGLGKPPEIVPNKRLTGGA